MSHEDDSDEETEEEGFTLVVACSIGTEADGGTSMAIGNAAEEGSQW